MALAYRVGERSQHQKLKNRGSKEEREEDAVAKHKGFMGALNARLNFRRSMPTVAVETACCKAKAAPEGA
jgi:hypothetical protein